MDYYTAKTPNIDNILKRADTRWDGSKLFYWLNEVKDVYEFKFIIENHFEVNAADIDRSWAKLEITGSPGPYTKRGLVEEVGELRVTDLVRELVKEKGNTRQDKRVRPRPERPSSLTFRKAVHRMLSVGSK